MVASTLLFAVDVQIFKYELEVTIVNIIELKIWLELHPAVVPKIKQHCI